MAALIGGHIVTTKDLLADIQDFFERKFGKENVGVTSSGSGIVVGNLKNSRGDYFTFTVSHDVFRPSMATTSQDNSVPQEVELPGLFDNQNLS
jgi:hypothetical protein